MQGMALDGLLKVFGQVAVLAGQIRDILEGGVAPVISPLVMSCLYESAFNSMWYYRESGRPDLVEPIKHITAGLRTMATIWKVGGQLILPPHASLFSLYRSPATASIGRMILTTSH